MKYIEVDPDQVEFSTLPLLKSVWCTYRDRAIFERLMLDTVAAQGYDPDTVTFHYEESIIDQGGTVHAPAVNVIWSSTEREPSR